MTDETGGKDSFGNSFSTDADGCGAWLAIGTSATALGLGAGGKAAIAGGVLMTGAAIGAVVAFVGGGVVAVFCASVTGAGGNALCGAGAVTGPCANVRAGPVVALFGAGVATGLGALVSFAVVVPAIAVCAIAGGGAIDAAVVTGLAAGLIVSVEISARKATAALVNLLMIDAIISVAGFVAGVSVAAGDGACDDTRGAICVESCASA